MKIMMKVLPVVALGLFMAACGGSKNNYQRLTAHQWKLDKVEVTDSTSKIAIPASKELTIAFSDSNKMVHGMASCNGYFGPYTVDGDKLSMGNLASTMMYCPDMPFESAYHAWLGAVDSYNATENTLTLRGGNNKVTLHYIKK